MSLLPIRWRLTLWYAGFFAAAMLLLGAGLYFGLRGRLNESLDEQVAAQAKLAQNAIEFDGDQVTLLTSRVTLLDDDAFIRLLGRDAMPVAYDGEWAGKMPFTRGPIEAAFAGRTGLSRLKADGDTVRVLTQPVLQGDTVVGVLQVGISSEDVNDTLTELLSLLAIGTLVVFVLGIGGGYLLAGRALAPVATITWLAGQIGDRDLHTRLNLTLPDDELGRLARTFDTMLDRIEEGFERQVRFTGDAAHELRTPLSLMRSQVDLALARPRSADEYRDALLGLDPDLERLSRLVTTLLTLTRADAGALPLERSMVDLDITIRLVLEQYGPMAAEHGVTLVDQTSRSSLVADEGMLIQVLVNLVSNALAYTPSGGTITVGCREEQQRVVLWVADTGPGIPAEHRDRIFDRFYRIDSGRSRTHARVANDRGTGLGLAIVKAFVEAHGGLILLVDRNDPGTRIEVTLPTAPERSTVPPP